MADPKASREQVSRFEFETQATSFDHRASLGPETARAATDAIVRTLALGPDDVLLEIGAGTGELGVHLAASTRGYIGVDGAEAMLELFRARAASSDPPCRPTLALADANARWPVDDGRVRGVFLSRVLHLLDRDHVLAELERVKRADGVGVLLGRRVRDPDAPAARLRRELHGMLTDFGYEPRRPERDGGLFLAALVERGATRIAPMHVARRVLRTSYRIELDAWRFKGGIAGISLPTEVRDVILADLERWAEAEVGDLEAPCDAGEAYVIEGAMIP